MNSNQPLPTVLMYCQHVSGIGHYIRSKAIAHALKEGMNVVMILGGSLPEVVPLPEGIDLIRLPPVNLDQAGEDLQSLDDRYTLAEAMQVRQQKLLGALEQWQPQALLIEHFPAGRLLFIPEILPFLDAAQALDSPPVVISSLREILAPQQEGAIVKGTLSHLLLNTYFDAVFVHGDPGFVPFETMLPSTLKLKIPLHYTGFVVPQAQTRSDPSGLPSEAPPYLVVSAGGGRLGQQLLETVIQAYQMLGLNDRYQLVVLAGVFLDEAAWRSLQSLAQDTPGVQLHRWLPNFRAVLGHARASISLCGYNTALDLIQTQVPALVIPGDEDAEGEQSYRATRLAELGLVQRLPAHQLDGATMATAIEQLLTFQPTSVAFDLAGATQTAQLIQQLLNRTTVS